MSLTSRSLRHGEGAPFLTELMAVILFFALSSCVIITLFTKADARSKDALRLSGAMNAATSACELVRTSDEPVSSFIAAYGGEMENGNHIAYLDPSFMPGGFEYKLELVPTGDEKGLMSFTVNIYAHDGMTIVYSLDCASFSKEAAS